MLLKLFVVNVVVVAVLVVTGHTEVELGLEVGVEFDNIICMFYLGQCKGLVHTLPHATVLCLFI